VAAARASRAATVAGVPPGVPPAAGSGGWLRRASRRPSLAVRRHLDLEAAAKERAERERAAREAALARI